MEDLKKLVIEKLKQTDTLDNPEKLMALTQLLQLILSEEQKEQNGYAKVEKTID